jgi:hypothetical protein
MRNYAKEIIKQKGPEISEPFKLFNKMVYYFLAITFSAAATI